MRRRIFATTAAALVLAGALAGCTPGAVATTPPATSPSGTSSAPGAVITGAEAAAAYKRYLRVYGEVGRDGGEDADRMNSVASDSALAGAISAADAFMAHSEKQTGEIVLAAWRAQTIGATSTTLYVCEDQRDFDVVDDKGKSVEPSTHFPYYEWVATVSRTETGGLVVSRVKPWNEGGVC